VTSTNSVRRFPRLLKDYPDCELTKSQRIAGQVRQGKLPRGYDKLTKKQKKLARLIINGMTVKDACRIVRMDSNTFYRYMRYHKYFKDYYLRYAHRSAVELEGRLDAKAGRAIQVVEEAMDNPDYYFAHDAAVKFLNGRGLYKKNTEINKQIRKNISLSGEITHVGKPLDGELINVFVEAMAKMASGQKEIKPKVVKGKVVEKVLNLLPEPAPSVDIATKMEEVKQAEAVRSDKRS
jgi:hypothetical protein